MSRQQRPGAARAVAVADLSRTLRRQAVEPAAPEWERRRELAALGRAVRELRARRGLSQEDLGFQAGLHRNYVGAVERGEINTTFRVLMKLSHGLEVPFSELIEVYERQRAWPAPHQRRTRS
jgi:ribosome-binding protein aMBF1 (putative translation factor)